MSFKEHTEDNIIFPRCEISFSQDVPLINLNVKTAKDVKKISLKLITYVEQRLESEMMHASLNPAFSMELVSTLFSIYRRNHVASCCECFHPITCACWLYRVSKKKLMLFQIQISCEFHYGTFPWVYSEQVVI